MRPFFSFYGGKWRDTPRNYPAPDHDTIIEPFAGSAGYSVRHHAKNVILCDLDPVIAGVWEYLISVTPDEILSLPDLDDDQSVDDLVVPQEARWLIGFWLNSGSAVPTKRPSAWMRAGKHDTSFWGDAIRNRIASQVEGIRHWQIIHGSYQTLENQQATWFIDPPYQEAGKHYKFSSKGIDYDHLGLWCSGRSGQVIVCEAGGADWLDFDDLGEIKTTRTGVRKREAVRIMNND